MPYDGKAEGRAYGILPTMGAAPDPLSGAGKFYTRRVSGVAQFFFLSEDGTETQLSPASALGAVSSVFGRTGAVVAANGDYGSDEITNGSGVAGANVSDALDALAASIVPAPVSSVFGRTGVVVAASGDYGSDEITNESGVAGANVSDALDALAAAIVPAPVSSVFGRTGAVVAASGDYGSSDITNESGFAGATITAVLDGPINTQLLDLTTFKAEKAITEVAYAGTARALTATDLDSMIVTSSGSAVQFTVPNTATETITALRLIQIFQGGAGQVSIVAAGGVTIQSLNSYLKCSGQNGLLTLWRVSANTWRLTGNLSA